MLVVDSVLVLADEVERDEEEDEVWVLVDDAELVDVEDTLVELVDVEELEETEVDVVVDVVVEDAVMVDALVDVDVVVVELVVVVVVHVPQRAGHCRRVSCAIYTEGAVPSKQRVLLIKKQSSGSRWLSSSLHLSRATLRLLVDVEAGGATVATGLSVGHTLHVAGQSARTDAAKSASSSRWHCSTTAAHEIGSRLPLHTREPWFIAAVAVVGVVCRHVPQSAGQVTCTSWIVERVMLL